MDSENTITTIIPTFKREQLLNEAILSVINQKSCPDELIISDSLGREKTKRIVSKLNKKSNFPIIYLSHKEGGFGCISRNIAAKKAKYKFIAFLDDDDLWHEDYIFHVRKKLKKIKKTKIIYTWWVYFNEKGTFPGKKIIENLKISKWFVYNPGSVISNLVVEKKLFLDLNGFDEDVHPPYDKDFIIRALSRNIKYEVIKKPLVFFRISNHQRESSRSRRNFSGQIKFYMKHKNLMNLYEQIHFLVKTLSMMSNKNFNIIERLISFFCAKTLRLLSIIKNVF